MFPLVWIIAAVGLLGVFTFGVVTIASSILVAIGVGLIVIGGARFVRHGPEPFTMWLIVGGGGLVLVDQFTDTLSLGDALTVLGGA